MPRGGGRVRAPAGWVISGNLRLETKSRETILSPSPLSVCGQLRFIRVINWTNDLRFLQTNFSLIH